VAAAVTAAPAPAATGAALLLGLAHVDLAAADVAGIPLRDGLAGLAGRAHLDEAETARPTGVPVVDDGCRFHRARSGEQRLEVRSGGGKCQISYEQLLTHDNFSCPFGALQVWSVCLSEKPRSSQDGRGTRAK